MMCPFLWHWLCVHLFPQEDVTGQGEEPGSHAWNECQSCFPLCPWPFTGWPPYVWKFWFWCQGHQLQVLWQSGCESFIYLLPLYVCEDNKLIRLLSLPCKIKILQTENTHNWIKIAYCHWKSVSINNNMYSVTVLLKVCTKETSSFVFFWTFTLILLDQMEILIKFFTASANFTWNLCFKVNDCHHEITKFWLSLSVE